MLNLNLITAERFLFFVQKKKIFVQIIEKHRELL